MLRGLGRSPTGAAFVLTLLSSVTVAIAFVLSVVAEGHRTFFEQRAGWFLIAGAGGCTVLAIVMLARHGAVVP